MKYTILSIFLFPLFFIGCMSKSVYLKIGEAGNASCSAAFMTGNTDCMMQGPVEYHSVPVGAPHYQNHEAEGHDNHDKEAVAKED